jgi:hypothetical protein
MAIEPIDTKLIDTLLAGYKKPEDIIGKNGLLKQASSAEFVGRFWLWESSQVVI